MARPKTAISPTRDENYAEWYQQVIRAAELADNSAVRGCMVIRPWGWAIWELIQAALDTRIKETGHSNAYFPLFVPMSFLQSEADHVDGFAKECAVVTHHRLAVGADGKLAPAAPLDEPYIVRPTSETIIGASFAKWIQSHRDLPVKINQWANVVRWELRPRMFLRTTEFLWQEGHTAHATEDEARTEATLMLEVYREFVQSVLAIPVVAGEKPLGERFPGAVATYTIESMMQDGKALQAGTSHFLGQNFSKAQSIKFQDRDGLEKYAWTTSWGVSTRLIGALIMSHSDDDGLVLPPRVAPAQVVLLPVNTSGSAESAELQRYVDRLKAEIESQVFQGAPIRVLVDRREMRFGERSWYHIKRGVPIRVEIGTRELEGQSVVWSARLGPQKQTDSSAGFANRCPDVLSGIQRELFDSALRRQEAGTSQVSNIQDLEQLFGESETSPSGRITFAIAPFAERPETYEWLKPRGLTLRCVPFGHSREPRKCVFTGEITDKVAIVARAY